MSSTDVRGFRDALLPVRQQRQWELDAALAKLSALRVLLEKTRERLAVAQSEASQQATLAGRAWQDRVDPTTHARLLDYLAGLQTAMAKMQQEISGLEIQLTGAQEQVMLRRRALDGLERHRDEALAEYRVEQDRKQSAEADQEWTMRAGFRGEIGA